MSKIDTLLHHLIQYPTELVSWNDDPKCCIHVLKGTNLECSPVSKDKSRRIRTTHPIPLNLDNFYFEVTIQDKGQNGSIEIGLLQMYRENFDDSYTVPKWNSESISYNTNGNIFRSDKWSIEGLKRIACEFFTQGDVIGCLTSRMWIDKVSFLTVQFIKNGEKVNDHIYLEDGYYCPIITMNSVGAKVATNFGQTEFSFQNQGNKSFI